MSNRRIGRSRDRLLCEVDLRDVAGTGGQDAVQTDARDVRTRDPPPLKRLVRVGGAQDVVPGTAAAQHLPELEQQRHDKSAPLDGRQVREEGLDGVEERLEARAERGVLDRHSARPHHFRVS
jgi:hypothetical protein